jgi:hypothetical protein
MCENVNRYGHYIKFCCAAGNVSIDNAGDLDTFGMVLSAAQLNEITRVRAALGWTGETK